MECVRCKATAVIEGSLMEGSSGGDVYFCSNEVPSIKRLFSVGNRKIKAFACLHCSHLELMVEFTDKAASKEFRELIRQSACNTFTTVLGPGSDDFHSDNIHLDLIERKSGYRICQWDVLTMPEAGSTVSPEQPHDITKGAD